MCRKSFIAVETASSESWKAYLGRVAFISMVVSVSVPYATMAIHEYCVDLRDTSNMFKFYHFPNQLSVSGCWSVSTREHCDGTRSDWFHLVTGFMGRYGNFYVFNVFGCGVVYMVCTGMCIYLHYRDLATKTGGCPRSSINAMAVGYIGILLGFLTAIIPNSTHK